MVCILLAGLTYSAYGFPNGMAGIMLIQNQKDLQ